MPGNDKPKEAPKKEGWKDRTKDFKTIIVKDKTFDGVVFMMDQVPLRKIGIEKTGLILGGMPTQTIMNASYKTAPPYRIVITEKGYKLYIKGTPSVLIN